MLVKKQLIQKNLNLLNNSLNDIHGLGIKRINNLLLKYGTINNIKHANIDDLILVRGVSHELAQNILQELNK